MDEPAAEDGYTLLDAPDAGRYELHRNGEMVAFARYHLDDATVVVPYIETVPIHRGQGNSERLMEEVLAVVRADRRSIRPLCSVAAAHVRARPQHHDLLEERRPS